MQENGLLHAPDFYRWYPLGGSQSRFERGEKKTAEHSLTKALLQVPYSDTVTAYSYR
jgi:hypothetical protein